MTSAVTRRPSAAPKAPRSAVPRHKPPATSAPAAEDAVSTFHPVLREWFRRRFAGPTDAQAAGWPAIRSGRDVLIAAPTGSGKTIAAFLVAIDRLLKGPSAEPITGAADRKVASTALQADPSTTAKNGAARAIAEVSVLYVSPLKALGNDIQRNLDAPLAEIREVAAEMAVDFPRSKWRCAPATRPRTNARPIVKTPAAHPDHDARSRST